MAGSSLTGSFRHTVDSKGRIFIPAKHRDLLGESIWVTLGTSDCFFAFSDEEFTKFKNSIVSAQDLSTAHKMTLRRRFIGNATECDIDPQGRICIPQDLRNQIDIGDDVIVAGLDNRLEIWNADKWYENNKQMSDEMILEALEGFDF